MSYHDLLRRLGAINDVLTSSSVLVWDSRTMMPARGAAVRGQQIATLSTVAAEMLTSDETQRLLDAADTATSHLPEDAPERRGIQQARAGGRSAPPHPGCAAPSPGSIERDGECRLDRGTRQERFRDVRALSGRIGRAGTAIGRCHRWSAAPYDALIGLPEPGETTASLRTLFARIRDGLAPLLRAVSTAPAPRADFLEADYPADQQHDFAL
ncbi:MAG: hypothetical protein WDN69_26175 [Aliidongia sp.]